MRAQALGAFSVMAIAGRVQGLVQLADEIQGVNARLKLAVNNTRDFLAAQKDLYALSGRTGGGYGPLAALYGRLSINAKAYNLTQAQVMAVTDATARSLQISGAKAQEAASATLQLAQALGAGALRGEEFNAVNEAAPRLMKALADGLGVPVGKLKQLAEQGLLTTDVVTRALESQADVLRREAESMPRLLSQAATHAKDEFGRIVDEGNKALGITAKIARGFDYLADHMREALAGLGVAAVTAFSVALGRGAGSIATYTTALWGKIAAHRQAVASARAQALAELECARADLVAAQATVARTTGLRRLAVVEQQLIPAQARLAAAQASVNAAMAAGSIAARGFSSIIGFLGGPIGALTTLLSLGATAWAIWGGNAETAGNKARDAASKITEAKEALERLRDADTFGEDQAAAARAAVARARAELSAAQSPVRRWIDDGSAEGLDIEFVDQEAVERAKARLAEAERILAETLARMESLAKKNAESTGSGVGNILVKSIDAYVQGFRDKLDPLAAALADLKSRAEEAGIDLASPQYKAWEDTIRTYFSRRGRGGGGASSRSTEIRSIRAALDAELSVIKDGLARQKQALEAALEDKLVSIRDYYSRKTSLEQQEIDAEIARTQALLAEQRRLAGSADESQRTTALAEVGRLEAELIVLNNRRADAAVTNARKAAQAERELADTLAELKLKLAEKQGTATDQDRMDALLRQYRAQMAAFKAEGDQAGVDLINRLINVEAAEANLSALEAKWRAAMDRLRNAQELIQIRQNAGLLTETEARRQIVDLQRQSAAELQGMLPAMQDAAGAIGPEAVERMAAYRNEIEQMRLGMDELAPLWADLGQGFGDALNNMLTGATTWRDGLTGLFRQISNSFLQHLVIKPFQEWVAVQARMLAVKTGFAQQEEAMDMAISTKKVGQKMQEAGTVVSANAAEAGSGAANSVANILYVGPILAVAAMATVFAAVMALMSKVKKFSTGGFVYGPGSSTSDSIPARLSAGEYVVRAEAVRRVGRNFLDNINGLKSGAAWSGGALAFADGGMVPEIEVPAGQSKATTVNNAVNLHVYDDPQRIADAAFNTRQGQDNFYLMLSRDPARVRSVLGI